MRFARATSAALLFVLAALAFSAHAKSHLAAMPGTTPQTTAPGQPFAVPLAVLVTDGGVPQPGMQVSFSATAMGPTGTFPGGLETVYVTTDANGVATAPTLTANMVVGTFQVLVGLPPPQLLPDNDLQFDLTIYEAPSPPGEKIWTGRGATANWSEGINWVGGVAPQGGDTVIFPDGALRDSSVADINPTTVAQIHVTAAAGHTFGGALTLTSDAPILVDSGGPVLLAGHVAIASRAATIAVRNPTSVPGVLELAASATIEPAGGTIRFDAPATDVRLEGTLGVTFPTRFVFSGGDFHVTGNNFYSLMPPFESDAHSLEVAPAVGSGIVPVLPGATANSGTLILGSTATVAPRTGNITLNAPGDPVNGNLVVRGAATLDQAFISGLSISGTQVVVFGPFLSNIEGPLTGSGELVLRGALDKPIVLVGAASTFTGTIRLESGHLMPSTTQSESVELMPGTRMTVDGIPMALRALSCASSASLGWSLATVLTITTGPLSIDGCGLTLVPPLGFIIPASGEILLVSNQSGAAATGTFAGMPEGATVPVNGKTMYVTYRGGTGRDIELLDAPPPPPVAQLQVAGGNRQSIPRGTIAIPFSVRAVDGSGNPVPRARIRFTMPGVCGSFGGAGVVTAFADSSGLATAPDFTAGNASVECTLVAQAIGSPASATLYASVYSPTNVSLAPSPISIATMAGATFAFAVLATDGSVRLPGLQVQFEVQASGSASVVEATPSATTDATGKASGSATGNGSAGTYAIVARLGSSSVAIPVTQSAVAPPPPVSAPLVQDMWWAGLGENGWGMSVVQHGDKLFAVIYAYDSSGSATWYVMPAGTWNDLKTAFTGDLYSPRGTPLFAYDASKLQPGAPVGSATLAFTDAGHAALRYTIQGTAGVKNIVRQPFGRDLAANGVIVGDMWWGGAAQNGWGIAVLQQDATLFSVWYAYDDAGMPVWYVMPGGDWTDAQTYAGRIYRTRGSPWLGGTYDPTRLQITDVGPYRIHFDGDNATFDFTIDGRSGSLPLTRQAF